MSSLLHFLYTRKTTTQYDGWWCEVVSRITRRISSPKGCEKKSQNEAWCLFYFRLFSWLCRCCDCFLSSRRLDFLSSQGLVFPHKIKEAGLPLVGIVIHVEKEFYQQRKTVDTKEHGVHEQLGVPSKVLVYGFACNWVILPQNLTRSWYKLICCKLKNCYH